MENILLIIFTFILTVNSESCYYRAVSLGFYYSKRMYCPNACCGSYYYRYCCYKTSGGTIAGAVIGGLVCLGIIIAVVVILILKKKRGSFGAIVRPLPVNNSGGVTIVQTSMANQYPVLQPPVQTYMPPPQGYNPHGPPSPQVYNNQGPPPPPPMYNKDFPTNSPQYSAVTPPYPPPPHYPYSNVQ